MQTTEAHWEDEENNRRVAFSVGYACRDGAIEIQDLTPKQVTFLCSKSRQPVRTINVWTEKGRALLERQLRGSGKITQVQQQVETALAV